MHHITTQRYDNLFDNITEQYQCVLHNVRMMLRQLYYQKFIIVRHIMHSMFYISFGM